MTKINNTSKRIADLSGLTAEQAYTVGASIGSRLKNGMPANRASDATMAIAEFIKRGQAAQKAVDAIIATAKSSKPR